MYQYPSIPYLLNNKISGGDVFVWDKLDGNNIRAEWNFKQNIWGLFGTRNQLISADDPQFGHACQLIQNKYHPALMLPPMQALRRQYNPKKIICFFEYCSDNSFAGQHFDLDSLDVHLFDAYVERRGILNPSEFTTYFKYIPTVQLLYHGVWFKDLITQVQTGQLANMTFEGVVIKQDRKYPRPPIMFKAKNQAWLDKLKIFCQNDPQKYELLR